MMARIHRDEAVPVVGEMAVRLSDPNLKIVEADSTSTVDSPKKR